MSRDWTPKELDMVQQEFKIPNMVDTSMILHIEGQEDRPLFTEEDVELSHKYPRLGMFGFDFLKECKYRGILKSEYGQELIQEIEKSFSGEQIDNTELYEKAQQWYNGELESGYDLGPNNEAFADYVLSLVKKEEKL